MSSFVSACAKFIVDPDRQPLIETLRRQAENTKLRAEKEEYEYNVEDEIPDDELLEGTGEQMAKGILRKISKLFAFTSGFDRFVLFVGLAFTVIHAASFPLLAILFGKISNAYIVHTIHEMQISPNSSLAGDDSSIGVSGQATLSLLSKFTAKFAPGVNVTAIPDAGAVQGSGYFGNLNLYSSNGTETVGDFATYVAEFSTYYFYIGIAVFFAGFFQTLIWEWMAENQLYRIRQKYIYQLQRQEMSWFSFRSVGNLVMKMTDDCERFREGVGQKFVLVIEYSIIALFGAGIGLLTNTKLTLVLLGSAPLVFTKLMLVWKKMSNASTEAQQQSVIAGKICVEGIRNIQAVAAFGEERGELERYEKALSYGTAAAKHKEVIIGLGTGGMYFLIYVFYAVALWYAVNLLHEGVISPGEIYTVFFSLTISVFAIFSLLPNLSEIASAYSSYRLVGTVLDSIPEIDPYSTSGLCPKGFTGKINFSNVAFAYPTMAEKLVLNELNFEVPGKGLFAIVGKNGAGKSALVRLMLRLYDPQSGVIKLDEHDITTMNVRWVRKQFAVVDRNSTLANTTIFENIRSFNKNVTFHDVEKAAQIVLLDKYIAGLDNKYDSTASALFPLDVRIKILIAKCIISKPKVLILREALSALKLSDACKILQTLKKCRQTTTTIVVDYKPPEVFESCDYIYFLKNGCVTEKGTPEELRRICGDFNKMFPTQLVYRVETERDEDETVDRFQVLMGASMKNIFDSMAFIRKLLKLMPFESRRLWYLGIVGCILSGLVIPLLALSLGQILDLFIGPRQNLLSSGINWVEVLLGLATLAAVGFAIRNIFTGYFAEDLGSRLRIASYNSILQQHVRWFENKENSPGGLYTRLSSDVPVIKNAMGPRLATAVNAIMTLITGLVITLFFSWEIAAVAFLTIPILVSCFSTLARVLKGSQVKLFANRQGIVDLTTSLINGIEAIQTKCDAYAGCVQAEKFLYPALLDGYNRAVWYSLVYATSECFMFFIFGAAFSVGAELLRHGILAVSDLFSIFFVLTFGILSVGQATSFIPEFFKAKSSGDAIFSLIDLKPLTDSADDFKHSKGAFNGEVEFQSVWFKDPLNDETELKNATFRIPAKSLVGIVGPPGSGQTTILALLLRFCDAQTGWVKVDGIDVRDWSIKHLRSNIGYVPSEPKLFDITVDDNIKFGYHGDMTGLHDLIQRAATDANLKKFIDELPEGFNTKCGENGKNLNPTQRQAIAIARAIIRSPPQLLLLEDIMALLDAEEEKVLLTTLDNVFKKRTTLIVTSSNATIRACTHIIVMEKGAVKEFGETRTLLARDSSALCVFLKDQAVTPDQPVMNMMQQGVPPPQPMWNDPLVLPTPYNPNSSPQRPVTDNIRYQMIGSDGQVDNASLAPGQSFYGRPPIPPPVPNINQPMYGSVPVIMPQMAQGPHPAPTPSQPSHAAGSVIMLKRHAADQ